MKVFSIKLILFLILVLAFLKVMDIIYTAYSVKHKNVCDKAEWIMNHSGNELDFAFIGNSRVENGIDINQVEDLTKKRGINLGVIGVNYAENFLLLDQFIRNGNSIKNLIIQVDMHSLNSTKELNYPFHDYKYMPLLNDTIVYAVFRDNVPAHKLFIWRYIPFTRYMEYSNRYVFYKILKGGFECTESDVYDATKGSDILPDKPKKAYKNSYVYWTVKENDKKYLLKLIGYGKQKKMNVVLYSAPVYSKYLKNQLKYKDILDEIKGVARSQSIPFFDFSSPSYPICTDPKYFNDNIHMNASGIAQFSRSISDSLKAVLN
jgi:hypothetical protein